eukprot:scaffold832_cov75-Skeletonema_dohrnii-CCMP3373.AAC.4
MQALYSATQEQESRSRETSAALDTRHVSLHSFDSTDFLSTRANRTTRKNGNDWYEGLELERCLHSAPSTAKTVSPSMQRV